MAASTINLDWLAHNAVRRYPLADDADGNDPTGSFRLPNDFLVSLDLPIHAGMDVSSGRFFLQSVAAFSGGYGIVVAYSPVSGDPVTIATALIPRQGFVRNSVFVLGGIGDFADTVGKVVIGRLENIDDQPPGQWEFDLTTARIDPDAIRPIIRGVSSITCVNGDQRSAPLYGHIELVAGANMQIVPITGGTNPVIRFNAIDGEGTVDPCVCEGDAAQTEPITSLSGVAPTSAGDFNIIGSTCIEVQPIANGIRIVDKCAQPCCGPTELEAITSDLERLYAQAGAVEGFVDELKTNVDTMSLIVLSSKLGDRGCITCP